MRESEKAIYIYAIGVFPPIWIAKSQIKIIDHETIEGPRWLMKKILKNNFPL